MSRFEKYDSQTIGEGMVGWFEVLDQPLIKERVSKGTPKITSVGIGADAGFKMDPWYIQSYEPYVLAAWAHSIDAGFKLNLIDANAHAIQNVHDGSFVYLDKIALSRDTKLQGAWLRIQREMGSPASTINANDGTLELIEPYESTTNVNYMVSQGMERVAVPSWFKDKIASSEIKLFNEDVRDVVGIQDQSLIFCFNVLLHYPQGDQALMLTKMSEMLGSGKLLAINEGKPDSERSFATSFRKTLFSENGGWLTEDVLRSEFNLGIANRSKNKRRYILEKLT